MIKRMIGAMLALAAPAILAAQVGLPGLGGVGDVVGGVTRNLPLGDLDARETLDFARRLASERIDRLRDTVARAPDRLALDENGNPAVKGELLVTGADPAGVARAEARGYRVTSRETIEGLDLDVVTLAAPPRQTLGNAVRDVRKLLPGADVEANPLHFASGAAATAGTGAVAQRPVRGGTRIGLIDGGVGRHPEIPGAIEQRGFAAGAPRGSAHGTAVASLIAAAAPGSTIVAADVYGGDPAGGNALAITRALGWMVARRVPVVTISLVGPPNPLLRAAVRIAQSKGTMIVAAVGNDGPAAPPAYPASYPGVIAVTGVDARNRALVEAGRALHLEFSAPGADMTAARLSGGRGKVRGTSYAAPLVAARLAAWHPAPAPGRGAVTALAREARDLGKRGPDKVFGIGLVCETCR